jgi:hypothetical protein
MHDKKTGKSISIKKNWHLKAILLWIILNFSETRCSEPNSTRPRENCPYQFYKKDFFIRPTKMAFFLYK